jgi:glycosyltransferase involved in cell wall biosynthesis
LDYDIFIYKNKNFMEKPLASFVCLTYNRHKLLEEVLYMFLNQTYENKELIIVNDQPNVEYYYDDPRVKIYNLKERFTSLGRKRNYAKSLASGEYIFFTDDDDVYYTFHMEKMINFLENDLEHDAVKNAASHCSVNNILDSEEGSRHSLFFSGICFRKKFTLTKDFDETLNVGEDIKYTDYVKLYHLEELPISHHYRWGMECGHISGYGPDPDAWEKFKLHHKQEYLDDVKITLIPGLMELTKKYYR